MSSPSTWLPSPRWAPLWRTPLLEPATSPWVIWHPTPTTPCAWQSPSLVVHPSPASLWLFPRWTEVWLVINSYTVPCNKLIDCHTVPFIIINGQAWSLSGPRGQLENRQKWRKLVVKSSVVSQRPSRLKDRWRSPLSESSWLFTVQFYISSAVVWCGSDAAVTAVMTKNWAHRKYECLAQQEYKSLHGAGAAILHCHRTLYYYHTIWEESAFIFNVAVF